jgi:hypothetical protein
MRRRSFTLNTIARFQFLLFFFGADLILGGPRKARDRVEREASTPHAERDRVGREPQLEAYQEGQNMVIEDA